MIGDAVIFHRRLDLRGLHCPVPIIRARATLELMGAGEVLYLVGSDRDFRWEVSRLAARFGHRLEVIWQAGGECHLLLCKNPTAPARSGARWDGLLSRLGLRRPRTPAAAAGCLPA